MAPTSTTIEGCFETGLLLDRRWHELRGEPMIDERGAVSATAEVFEATGTPWAIIGGVALQLRVEEPRTTVDLDVAVLDRESLPRDALAARGFRRTGSFEPSEDREAPDGTPVQFADDPRMAEAVRAAELVEIEGIRLRVARARELLRLKPIAAGDETRRRSKRARDVADALALTEAHPELERELTDTERAVLDR